MLREESVTLEGLPGKVMALGIGLKQNEWVAICGDIEQRVATPFGVFFPPEPVRFPVVRWMDQDRFFLADARTAPDRDNAWILSDEGEVLATFCAGDGIEDVLIAGSEIIVTYFDDGVFASIPPSEQGVCGSSSGLTRL